MRPCWPATTPSEVRPWLARTRKSRPTEPKRSRGRCTSAMSISPIKSASAKTLSGRELLASCPANLRGWEWSFVKSPVPSRSAHVPRIRAGGQRRQVEPGRALRRLWDRSSPVEPGGRDRRPDHPRRRFRQGGFRPAAGCAAESEPWDSARMAAASPSPTPGNWPSGTWIPARSDSTRRGPGPFPSRTWPSRPTGGESSRAMGRSTRAESAWPRSSTPRPAPRSARRSPATKTGSGAWPTALTAARLP